MRALSPLFLLPVILMVRSPGVLSAEGPAHVYRGATVLTVGHGEITDADFVVQDGKFLAVGKHGEVAIPAGAEVYHLEGKVVIPGLVDTHSHIGIYPRPAVAAHQDGNEMTGAVQAALRALDAIWPEDPGIRMALTGGVTTANIMPGSGNVIGGQTLYVKLRPGPITNMMVQPGTPEGGLKMANGENPKRVYGSKNQPPGTRMAWPRCSASSSSKPSTIAVNGRPTVKLRKRPKPARPPRKPGPTPSPRNQPSPSMTWRSSRLSKCSIAGGPSIFIRIGPTTS
jgi:hypothetical protein